VIRIAFLLFIFATPALAQQAPLDPATLQRALAAVQQQRNAAMDQTASAQIEAMRLAEEVAKLKAEIEAIKKPAEK